MGVDVGHRLNGLLGLDDQLARCACRAGSHCLRGLEQLIVVDAAMGEADTRRLFAIHDGECRVEPDEVKVLPQHAGAEAVQRAHLRLIDQVKLAGEDDEKDAKSAA